MLVLVELSVCSKIISMMKGYFFSLVPKSVLANIRIIDLIVWDGPGMKFDIDVLLFYLLVYKKICFFFVYIVWLIWGLTSHKRLKSYRDGSSVYSLIRQT